MGGWGMRRSSGRALLAKDGAPRPRPAVRDEVREAGRLLHEEEDDEGAEHDLLDVLQDARVGLASEGGRRRVVQRDREEDDERGAEEGARDAPEASENDDEEDL